MFYQMQIHTRFVRITLSYYILFRFERHEGMYTTATVIKQIKSLTLQ